MLEIGDPIAELTELQELREPSFVSNVPLIGSVIVWFRTLWNNVATRWYVLPLVQQQNAYNRQLVSTLDSTLHALQDRLVVLEETTANLDMDQVTLGRDLAETRFQVIRAQRDIATLQLIGETAKGSRGKV